MILAYGGVVVQLPSLPAGFTGFVYFGTTQPLFVELPGRSSSTYESPRGETQTTRKEGQK